MTDYKSFLVVLKQWVNELGQWRITAFKKTISRLRFLLFCFVHLSAYLAPKYRYEVCSILIEHGRGWNSFVYWLENLCEIFLKKTLVKLASVFYCMENSRNIVIIVNHWWFSHAKVAKYNMKLPVSFTQGVSN